MPILRFLTAIIAIAAAAHKRNAVERTVREPSVPEYNPPSDESFTSPPPTDRFTRNGIPVRSRATARPPAISMQSHLIRSAFPECSEIFAQAFPITGKMVPKLMAFGIRRVLYQTPPPER